MSPYITVVLADFARLEEWDGLAEGIKRGRVSVCGAKYLSQLLVNVNVDHICAQTGGVES